MKLTCILHYSMRPLLTGALAFCTFGLMITLATAVHGGDLRAGPGDDLFATPKAVSLIFEISADELKAMQKGSHQYGRCTVREGDASYPDVGIRYKGNPVKEAASGKPDFTVEFNEFVSGQKFHGLKRVLLLAARKDPSYLSAPIGLELFRQAGIPVPRSAFALVRLNGKGLGLYILVEGVDRDFL